MRCGEVEMRSEVSIERVKSLMSVVKSMMEVVF